MHLLDYNERVHEGALMNRKARVLVVEDELIIAQNIERYLGHLGYDVLGVCSSSQEVRAMLEELLPDVVLMDIRIEGDEDGVAIAEYLHREKGIPVVFLTALMDEETLQRAKITQPFGYIVKPFSQRELHISLEIALYKSALERKLQEQEVFLQTLIDGMPQGFCLLDTERRIAYANQELGHMLGLSRASDAVGLSLDQLIMVSGGLKARLTAEKLQAFEAGFVGVQGEQRVIVTPQLVAGKNGASGGTFISFTAIQSGKDNR